MLRHSSGMQLFMHLKSVTEYRYDLCYAYFMTYFILMTYFTDKISYTYISH